MSNELSVKIDVQATIRALTIGADKWEKAAAYALGQVALTVEREAKINAATGTHPRGKGHLKGTGPGPNRVTGALQRSIHTEVRKGFGSYEAEVFPSMIYARQVEIGGGKWPRGVNYPYMIPAGRSVKPRANDIFTNAMARKLRR